MDPHPLQRRLALADVLPLRTAPLTLRLLTTGDAADVLSGDVAERALRAGFIVNPCTSTTIRLAPPFLLTQEQAATFVDFLASLPRDLA